MKTLKHIIMAASVLLGLLFTSQAQTNYINNFDGDGSGAAAAGYVNPPWNNLGVWDATSGVNGSPGIDVQNNLTPYLSAPVYDLTMTNTVISSFVKFKSLSGNPLLMMGFSTPAGATGTYGGAQVFLLYVASSSNLGYRSGIGYYVEDGTLTNSLSLNTNEWYRYTLQLGPVNPANGAVNITEIIDDWGTSGASLVANIANISTNLAASSLTTGATAGYPVIYFGGANNPTYSATMDNFETLQNPLNPPAGIPNVVAGPLSLSVTWSNVLGASSYIVERSTTSGGSYTAIATNSANPFTTNATSTYVDSGLSAGTSYYYVIVTGNKYVGNSGVSLEGTGIPLSGGSPPLAPQNPVAINGTNQVPLTWDASATATSYNVYRSTTSGGETFLASSATTSYTDNAVVAGTTYYYEVTAVNGAGEGGYSVEVSATPVLPPISLSSGAIGAIVGSNAVVTLSVPASVTASSPATITLTSGNPVVTANQTVVLPVGITSTNLSFPVAGVGVSTVTATGTGLASASVQVTGALVTINLPGEVSAAIGGNAAATLTLTCPFAFSGSYTVTLTSGNTAVTANQTVTLPAGVDSTNLSFPILASGFSVVTASGSGLNPTSFAVGDNTGILGYGLANQWVGDDYVAESQANGGSGNWVDRVSGVVAALDGNGFTPPIAVANSFGNHAGVERDPNFGDTGFSIPAANPPTGLTNWTVAVVVLPTAPYLNYNYYYIGQLIIGYDVGGAGKTDWGISWGSWNNGTPNNNNQQFDVGTGLGNGNDLNLNGGTTPLALNVPHAVVMQASGGNTLSLYIDGALAAQATGLQLQGMTNSNGTGVIPLLSTVGANIGNIFTNLVGEVRIYTNGVVNGALLSANIYANYGGVLPPPNSPAILPVYNSAGNLVFRVATQTGYNYYLESTTNLNPPIVWSTNATTAGTGGTITNTAPINSALLKQFFRYLVQ
jgi:hypothetical protein